jgi:hypothetical protein
VAAKTSHKALTAMVHNPGKHLTESGEILATEHALIDEPSKREHNREYEDASHSEALRALMAEF